MPWNFRAMPPLIWPLKKLVVPCSGATVSVARAPELITLPVAAEARALPPSPAMVRLWPLRSNLPVSMGEMMIWLLVMALVSPVFRLPLTVKVLLLGRLLWPANCTVPSLICIVRRFAVTGAMTLLLAVTGEINRVPGPDLVKLVAVKLPDRVDVPVWPSRT